MNWKSGLVFEADKGAGGGPTPESPKSSTGTPPEQPADTLASAGEKKFSQAELDQIVKERLERERKKTQTDADELRRKADAEAAAKNGEWQKLAEQREAELKAARAEAGESKIRAIAARLGMQDEDYAVFLASRAGDKADPEEVLKEHLKKAPQSQDPQTQKLPANRTNPAGPGPYFTRTQLRDPKFYRDNRDAIMAAVREGRIREG